MKLKICWFITVLTVFCCDLNAEGDINELIESLTRIKKVYDEISGKQQENKGCNAPCCLDKISEDKDGLLPLNNLLTDFEFKLNCYRDYRKRYHLIIQRFRYIKEAGAIGAWFGSMLMLPELAFYAGRNICFRARCSDKSPPFNIGGLKRCFSDNIQGMCARYAYNQNPTNASLESLIFVEDCYNNWPEELLGQPIPNEGATFEGRPECVAKFTDYLFPVALCVGGFVASQCINLSVALKQCRREIALLKQAMEQNSVDLAKELPAIITDENVMPQSLVEMIRIASTWTNFSEQSFISDDLGTLIKHEIQKDWRAVVYDMLFLKIHPVQIEKNEELDESEDV